MNKKIPSNFGKLFDEEFDSMLEQVIGPNSQQVALLPVKLIASSPYQPRKYFDLSKIKKLADSIAANGLLQPITVVKQKHQYLLVSGERRLKAVKMLCQKTIKGIVMNFNAIEHCQASLVENIQRENLSVIEEALSYHNLLRLMKMDHYQLAQRVGKSRSYITNSLRLLQLTPYIQTQLIDQKISSSKARALIVIARNNPTYANELCDQIIQNHWTIQTINKQLTSSEEWRKLKQVEQELRQQQHLNVRIDYNRIIIRYNKTNFTKIIALLEEYQSHEL